MADESKIEYKKMLNDMHKENIIFSEKIIIGFSTAAIGFIIGQIDAYKDNILSALFIILSLILFFLTVLLQLLSFDKCREACDISLDDNNNSNINGKRLFDSARIIDKIRNICFLTGMATTVLSAIVRISCQIVKI